MAAAAAAVLPLSASFAQYLKAEEMSADKAFCWGEKSNGAEMGLIRVSWAGLGSTLLCLEGPAARNKGRGWWWMDIGKKK